MHTLARNAHHNERLIEYCLPKAYPRGVSIERLTKDNIINGTQVAEMAISRISGIPMCEHGEHRDLVDDSDVKTITVYNNRRKKPKKKGSRSKTVEYTDNYVAKVKNISSKIGVLRVMCYNPFSDEWFFFMIPPSAYKHLKWEVSISFDKVTQLPTGKNVKYLVATFEDICRPLSFHEKVDALICNAVPKTVEYKELIDSITKLAKTYYA